MRVSGVFFGGGFRAMGLLGLGVRASGFGFKDLISRA